MAIGTPVSGTAAANTVAGTSLAVPYPASISAGDILECQVGCSSATSATVPGGWTDVSGAQSSGGSSPSLRVFNKIATGSESGSLSVTTPNSTSQGRMRRIPGVDQTTPVDTTVGVYNNSSAVTPFTISAITTSVANCLLSVMGVGNASTGTWTPPTTQGGSWNETWDVVTTTPKITHDYKLWSSSGGTSTFDLAPSAGVRGCAVVVAYRPAGAATNFPRTTTDSLSTSDTCTAVVTLARTASDSLSTADAAAATSSHARTATDSLSTADTVARSISDGRTATDSLSTADSTAGTTTHARTTSDALTVADTSTRTSTHPRAVTETLATSDTAAAVTAQGVTASDSIAPADTADRSVAYAQATSDSLSLSDLAVTGIGQSRAILEALLLTDTSTGHVVYDTSRYRDITVVIGTLYGYDLTVGAVTGRQFTVGVATGHPLAAARSQS